jgi:hypothetical protein
MADPSRVEIEYYFCADLETDSGLKSKLYDDRTTVVQVAWWMGPGREVLVLGT